MSNVSRTRYKKKLPPPVDQSYTQFRVEDPGAWLVLSDLHIPYHDKAALEAAVAYGRRQRPVGILLNGDVLDFHELSTFDKDPTAPRYREERRLGIAFLEYLRERFPAARIVYKEGNHEERLWRYLMKRAEALFGLEILNLPSMLEFERTEVEFIGERRVVRFGHLNVIHGHEYRPTIQAPVNPARGLYLRSSGNALCGHFHQTSEHHQPTITGKPQGCWSTGALCQLTPPYMPLNKWNHGAALVELAQDGSFSVNNFRVIHGKVV